MKIGHRHLPVEFIVWILDAISLWSEEPQNAGRARVLVVTADGSVELEVLDGPVDQHQEPSRHVRIEGQPQRRTVSRPK
jgi:hypothetical protein